MPWFGGTVWSHDTNATTSNKIVVVQPNEPNGGVLARRAAVPMTVLPNDDVVAQVRDDVLTGLGAMFVPNPDADPQFVVHPEFEDEGLIGNERVAVVPWIYYGLNNRSRADRGPDPDPPYVFEDLFRSDDAVEIHGVTFVDNREGEPMMHRYVDWLGVATQLGLEVSWRVPVDEDHYRSGRVIDDG